MQNKTLTHEMLDEIIEKWLAGEPYPPPYVSPCVYCGDLVAYGFSGPIPKFCNSVCRSRHYSRYVAKRAPTACGTCGKVFMPERSSARYCSGACRQKAYRLNVSKPHKDNPFDLISRIILESVQEDAPAIAPSQRPPLDYYKGILADLEAAQAAGTVAEFLSAMQAKAG
jgi:hypothetical protein